MTIDVSCIIPVRNGANYLRECLISLLNQDLIITFEICVFDDGSVDETPYIILEFSKLFLNKGIKFSNERECLSRGVGYAKNRAINISSGKFLCFCDADDINSKERLQLQFNFINQLAQVDNCIIGSTFKRIPEESTLRFTEWACSLKKEQLHTQTSFGPTIIAPTWFMSIKLYKNVGGFTEKVSVGFPEDLDFFYRALRKDAKIFKINQNLVLYRYHNKCSSLIVSERSIWNMRLAELERNVLKNYTKFTIWNAGKQGKRFFRSLSNENKKKVIALCDVDEKKIARGNFDVYDDQLRKVIFSIPIINYRESKPPVIICIKLLMTNNVFEKLLDEKKWQEGVDFFHFN